MIVKYGSAQDADTGRRFSPAIWSDCPIGEIRNWGTGIILEDDFVGGGLITVPTTSAALVGIPYSGFGSAGSTNAYGTAEVGGTIVLSETTVDEAVSLFTANHPFLITEKGQKLWFEARIKMALTATTENSFFVGLTDSTAKTVIVPLTATGELADLNLVGFHKPEANTTTFNGSYKANTVTAVPTNTGIGALVADTYVKLGMKFDPEDGAKLSWYINGVKQASTKTIPDATGTDFPADAYLGPCFAMAVGAAANDNSMTIDWFRVVQLQA